MSRLNIGAEAKRGGYLVYKYRSHLPPLYRATSDGLILTARSVGYIATLSGRTGTGEDFMECEEAWVGVDGLMGGLVEEILMIDLRCGGYHAH